MSLPRLPRGLLLLAVFALVLRLAPIAVHAGRPLRGDEIAFDRIAANVAAGHGYSIERHPGVWVPTALRGPSYVLFLAACYALVGRGATFPLAVQALLDAASVLLVYGIARRWFGRRGVPLTAAALYAVYAPFILTAGMLLNETFTQFTLLASVLLFFHYLDTRRLRALVASAAVLGLCALAKPQLAPVGVLLCAVAAGRTGLRRAVRDAAVVVVVVTLLFSPWIVRNAITFHRFMPGLSMVGMGLWCGAGPLNGRDIGGLDAPGVPDSLRNAVEGMGELQANQWAVGEARRLVVDYPGRYARLTVRKFFRLWFNVGFWDPPSKSSLLVAAFNLAAFVLGIFGALRGSARRTARLFAAWLFVYWTVVYVPFVTVVRYAFPYFALLFTFTAAGALELARRAGIAVEEPAARGETEGG